MEITGKVVRLGGLTEGTSAKGPWRKQDLIIETDDQYPKTVCLTCWTNQIDEVQRMVPGQMIKAQIDISSREFNGKWYTDVRVWRFEPVAATAPAAAPQPAAQPVHQTPPAAPAGGPEDYFGTESNNGDDLPF
ncbi:MAG: DUF3127 domain-containing protein [Bacteroidales bacterium]|nr:DUF3127 domain-containing protein [Bacteroidales bacterium]MBR0540573.1 DUF3127 domain-containing protein [Bacteroidales bacterium]